MVETKTPAAYEEELRLLNEQLEQAIDALRRLDLEREQLAAVLERARAALLDSVAERRKAIDDKEAAEAELRHAHRELLETHEQRRQAIDALREIAEDAESWELPPRGIIAIAKRARLALVKLGEAEA